VSLTASNLDQFFASIDRWIDDAEKLTVAVARGLSSELFNYAVRLSPQYSGDFAGNWKYAVGSVDASFEPLGLRGARRSVGRGEDIWAKPTTEPFIQGDAPAINAAISLNAGNDLDFQRLGQIAYVSNSAAHTDFYAWKIENNQINFRAGNTGATGQRAMAAVRSLFVGPLGIISRSAAVNLSNRHIGAWS
jgi:hypothetical protein